MDNELKQLRAVFGLLPSRHSPTELVNVFSLNRENVRKYFRTLKVRKYESTSGSTCVHVTFVRAHASRFEKVGWMDESCPKSRSEKLLIKYIATYLRTFVFYILKYATCTCTFKVRKYFRTSEVHVRKYVESTWKLWAFCMKVPRPETKLICVFLIPH